MVTVPPAMAMRWVGVEGVVRHLGGEAVAELEDFGKSGHRTEQRAQIRGRGQWLIQHGSAPFQAKASRYISTLIERRRARSLQRKLSIPLISLPRIDVRPDWVIASETIA